MIVWINGAYGSGKSTAAHALVERIPGIHIDGGKSPEEVVKAIGSLL